MSRKALVAVLGCALFLVSTYFLNNLPPVPSTKVPTTPPIESQSHSKILIVTGEYSPYTSETLTDKGFFTQIVTTIFQKTGLDCEIAFYPWARCEEMVRTGKAWAAFPYGAYGSIARKYQLSSPIYTSNHRFFYLKTDDSAHDKMQTFHTLTDFKDYTVGGTNGYWYGSKADLQAKGIKNVEWAGNVDGLVNMLYNRRIDMFIEDELVGWTTIKKLYPNEIDKFATLRNIATSQEYVLIVSSSYPHSDDILKQFNATLSLLSTQDTLNEIVTSHLQIK